jgi:hypothetical protein
MEDNQALFSKKLNKVIRENQINLERIEKELRLLEFLARIFNDSMVKISNPEEYFIRKIRTLSFCIEDDASFDCIEDKFELQAMALGLEVLKEK